MDVEAAPDRAHPEVELLLRCARRRIGAGGAEQIRGLLRRDVAWDLVIRLADWHRISPLFYRGLKETCPGDVPGPVLDRLRASFQANARRNLYLASELVRVLGRLNTEGIGALPFKGPVLAASVQGSLALRQFRDLDILVRRSDFPRAAEVLARPVGPGSRLRPVEDPRAELLASPCENHQCFVRDDGRLTLELHWDFLARRYAFPLDIDDLQGRLVPVPIADTALPSIPPEELLLFLCAHGTKHTWARLGWASDVAELIRPGPPLDWDRVLGQARAWGTMRILRLGLLLADDLFGAASPGPIARGMRGDPVAVALAEDVRQRLLWGEPAPPPDARRGWTFYVESRERLRDRTRCCRLAGMFPSGASPGTLPFTSRIMILGMTAITPNATDRAFLRLPKWLSVLYFLVRPVCLALEYGRRPRCLFALFQKRH